MSAVHIEDVSYQDLKKMSIKELKTLVSQNASRLNKRLKRISEHDEVYQGARLKAKETGGKFSVKGKDKEALLREASREKSFARSEGSSLGSARKISVTVERRRSTSKASKEFTPKQETETKEEYIERAKRNYVNKIKKSRKYSKKEKTEMLKPENVDKYEMLVTHDINDRIGKAWENFHRMKEENPAITYSKGGAKNIVNEFAYGGIKTVKGMKQSFNDLFEDGVKDNEEQYDEWTTVGETPFTVV